MPGGTFAGAYSRRDVGNPPRPWVDPTDSTITGDNAIGDDLVNKPVTISFWFKFSQARVTWLNTMNSFFVFGRWTFEPHHNAANNKGFSCYMSNMGWLSYYPTITFQYGALQFRKVLHRSTYTTWNLWDTANMDGWMHVLAYFTPGEPANDYTKHDMYFNNDNTKGTFSNNRPTATDIFPNYTDATIIGNSFSNPYYYLTNVGNRTILGATTDNNGGYSDPNRGYQMKELVVYDRVITAEERNTIWNNGTSLGDKDLYPDTPLTGYLFPNSMTYEPEFYNNQQKQTGRWKVANVYGSKYHLTSNYYRVTSNNDIYAKMDNYPSSIILETNTAMSN
tara:strand:- start:322 stop:1326 length:1005 start_codon:yes stop_codon:yes gene_type:complete